MSKADGLSGELNSFLEKVAHSGELAVEAVKEQIDIETDQVESMLIENTPIGKTGRLKGSLTKRKINEKDRYGYTLTYDGEDEYGNSYEKIANVLNYGTSQIRPRKFITRAVKKLKGLDERASKRFEEKVNNLNGGTDGN